MYCFEDIEFKVEDPEELELFPYDVTEELKGEMYTETQDAESKLPDGNFSSSLDLGELLSTSHSFSTYQPLNDFLQETCSEDVQDENQVAESWNELYSYGIQGTTVESDFTKTESDDAACESFCSSSSCLGYTDDKILSMSAKEINRMKGLTRNEINLIKKRRRVLLNRSYARKSREKRLDAQTSSNQEKENLKRGMDELQEELEAIRRDRDMYKEKYNALREIIDRAVSERMRKNIGMLYSN